MESSRQTLSHHYVGGLPYVKTLTFSTDVIPNGTQFTVGSRTYEVGVDIVGNDADAVLDGLVDAVNANPKLRGITHNNDIPNEKAYAGRGSAKAILYGRLAADDFTFTTVFGGATVATTITGAGGGITVNLDNLTLELDDVEEYLGALNSAKVTDPDAASASLNQLLRGILEAVNNQVVAGGLNDASTLTNATPNTSAVALAASSVLNYLLISCPFDNTDDVWVNFGGAAAVSGNTSVQLKPGGVLVYESNFIPTDSVNIVSATASQTVTIKYA